MNAGESQNAAGVRRTLAQLVSTHGVGILDDSRRVRAMLADAVAGATAEANLIGLALSAGVATRLRDAAQDPGRAGTALSEVSAELQRSSSVQAADADWAVGAIAGALGIAAAPVTAGEPVAAPSAAPRPAVAGPNDLVVQIAGQEHVATPGSVVTIGRDPGCTITLDASVVSRQHGRVQLGATGWEYVNLDSTQGSFVGGSRVRTHTVQGNTTVMLGQGAQAVSLRLAPFGRAATAVPPAAASPATEVPQRPGGALGSMPAARTEVGGAGAVVGPSVNVTLGGTSRTVPAGGSLTIGRETDNDLVAQASTVSRHHVRIEGAAGSWRLRDLGSTSGTWLGGTRVTDVALAGRQDFVLGDPTTGNRLVTDAPGVAPSGPIRQPRSGKRSKAPLLAAGAVAAVIALVAGGVVVWQNVSGDDTTQTASRKLTPDELAKGTVQLSWSDANGTTFGSGTIIDKARGLILTNAHVAAPAAVGSNIRDGYVFYDAAVKNPSELDVLVSDGVGKPANPRFKAEVVAADGYLNLAVLKITKTSVGAFPEKEDLDALTQIPVGDSDTLEPTDELTVIGYPGAQKALGPTYGTAVVSNWTGDDRLGTNKAFINSTDLVAHGNSGGLAADSSGKLVGVPSLLLADNLAAPGSSPDYTTVGSAIRPVNLAKPLIDAAVAFVNGKTTKQYASPYAEAAPTGARILGFAQNAFQEPQDPGSVVSSDCRFNGDTKSFPNYAWGVRYKGFSGNAHTDVVAVFTDPSTGDVVNYSVTKWQTPLPKNGCMVVTSHLTALPRSGLALTIAVGGDVKPLKTLGALVTPGPAVRVELLGPLRLAVGDEPVEIRGPKLRAIVAMLALAGGRIVSVDDLLDGVWGEDLPNTARNTLQYHVGVLRKALAQHGCADRLVTRDPGYALEATTDVSTFLSLSSQAERLRTSGDNAGAARTLTDALNLWAGAALADLQEFEFAAARAVALTDQRLTCLESWADAELACGRADALVAPLQDLVSEHPTRERLWEQLMVALYRTGRQDAALSAFRSARIALDRELGVNPSKRLVSVHQAILNHDPKLAPLSALPARPARPARPMTQTILARSEIVRTPPTLVSPSGQRVVLADRPVVLGRSEECDLVLLDDQASRKHAQVSPAGNGFVVEDLGSTNGTWVNGEPVSDLVGLADGDRIQVGHSVVRFVART